MYDTQLWNCLTTKINFLADIIPDYISKNIYAHMDANSCVVYPVIFTMVKIFGYNLDILGCLVDLES